MAKDIGFQNMNDSHGFSDQALAEALPFALLLADQHQLMVWGNQQARTWLGADSSCVGQPIKDLLGMDENLFSQRISTWNLTLQQRQLRLKRLPYKDDSWIFIFEDVSHVDALENMRQVFIANVSHELRTPLTVFRGYLEMLRERLPDDPAVLADILEQMNFQSKRMGLLVEDLLLLSRLESHPLEAAKQQLVVVPPMLTDICRDARQLSGNKQHQITEDYDESIPLTGSADELHSAFSNLVFNAVHYSRPHSSIHVRWFRDSDCAVLAVQDQGIGIPHEDIDRITERFYRVDKARSWNKAGGTGLGLAIVKHVLIRHNAILKIVSEENKGSCFRCEFPLN